MPIVIVKEVRAAVASDSRDRMVQSAAALISTRGISATSFSDVLADSGAPRGSIYHHFPDGKQQLAEQAVRYTSDRVLAYLKAGPPGTPTQVLQRFVGLWRRVVAESDGRTGCVVAGVAVDTDDATSELMTLARATFRSWAELLAEQLTAAGIPAREATPLALTALATMEGALILCRAEGGPGPLDTVGAQLLRLVEPLPPPSSD